MSLLCALNRHAADARVVENGGVAFATCRRCRREVIKRGDGGWEGVPAGLRVVWRPPAPPAPYRPLPRARIARGGARDAAASGPRTGRALAAADGIDWQQLRRALSRPLPHAGAVSHSGVAADGADDRAAAGGLRQGNR